MNFKRSLTLLTTATLLAFSCSVVHADSIRQARIKDLENQKTQLEKKNGVESTRGLGYALTESKNKINKLNKQVESLKIPYSEKNTIKVSSEYSQALKDSFNHDKTDMERNKADEILNIESSKLRLQKDSFVPDVADEAEVYDLDNLPQDVMIELNYFALNMINQVRRQMGTTELTLAQSSVDFASKLSSKVKEANRGFSDWHYVKGINEVAREYGLPTSSKEEEEKEYGGQYYENGASTSWRPEEITKVELKRMIYDTILDFLYNGYEYLHAQSIAGVNWGKPSKAEYFGLSIHLLKDGTGMSFINVSDYLLSQSTKNNFSTKNPSNTTENNRKNTLVAKQKELQSEKIKLEKLQISYKEYEKMSDELNKLYKEEKEEEEEKREKKGWIKKGETWYFYKNNKPIKNTWEGDYWFGSDGKMATDTWVDNGRYYVDKSGKYVQNKNQKYGWVKEGSAWYFYKNNKPIKNTWEGDYWFGSDGKMATDTWVDNGRYYVDGTGRYVQNKKQVEKTPSKPAIVPSSKKNGWIQEGKTWYFYKNNQPLRNTWQGSYYLKSDGKMAVNEWVYDSYYKSWYYLKSDGNYSRSSWQGSYYLKSNGKMAASEWIYDSSYKAWYYLKSNGVYARNEVIEGKYKLDYSGKWI